MSRSRPILLLLALMAILTQSRAAWETRSIQLNQRDILSAGSSNIFYTLLLDRLQAVDFDAGTVISTTNRLPTQGAVRGRLSADTNWFVFASGSTMRGTRISQQATATSYWPGPGPGFNSITVHPVYTNVVMGCTP